MEQLIIVGPGRRSGRTALVQLLGQQTQGRTMRVVNDPAEIITIDRGFKIPGIMTHKLFELALMEECNRLYTYEGVTIKDKKAGDKPRILSAVQRARRSKRNKMQRHSRKLNRR